MVDGRIRQAVWKWPRCRPCVVEERALQVVAARRGAEEPVAHQVAGADLELERLVRPRRVSGASVISSDGSLSSAATSPICGADALRVRRPGSRRAPASLLRRAVPAEHVAGRCSPSAASGRGGAGAPRRRGRGRRVGRRRGRPARCGAVGRRPAPGCRRRRRPAAATVRAPASPRLRRSSRGRAAVAAAVAVRRRPPALAVAAPGCATGTTWCCSGAPGWAVVVHVHAVHVPRVTGHVHLGGTAVVARGRRDHHGDRGRRDGEEAADAPGAGRGVELHRVPRSGLGP